MQNNIKIVVKTTRSEFSELSSVIAAQRLRTNDLMAFLRTTPGLLASTVTLVERCVEKILFVEAVTSRDDVSICIPHHGIGSPILNKRLKAARD